METNNPYIDELIALNLAGEANVEQAQELQEWLSQNANNEAYFKQLQNIFDAAAKAKEMRSFDTDKAWNKVQAELKNKPASKGKLIQFVRNSDFLKVAATFLLLIGVTYFINGIYNKQNQNQVSIKTNKQVVEKLLADGSVVHLNKKSQLKYDADFNSKNRIVHLSGEAFFDVKHNENKPFTVKMGEVNIEDVGTSFNVKAYPSKEIIEVAVVTGEVKFYTDDNLGIELKAGEEGSYDKNKKIFRKAILKDKNTAAYKDKIFVFENTDLHTVIALLNDVYQCNIVFANPALANCQLSVTFENESLDKVLEVIALTFNLKVEKGEKNIILDGTACGK